MTISPRFKEELRNRITLSDYIGQRVRLSRAGREFKGCCPFHNEKTPSFYVNNDKQFYHCFGCGAHGDVINFAMQNENLSFIDAIEKLAAEVGMQVPKPTPQAREKARKEKDLYSLLEDTTRFFESSLKDPANREALKYLRDRGMADEVMSSFRVGYAVADRQALRKHLCSQGYSDDQMIEAGVLRPSTRGGEPYAFFRERIMFPVADRKGRVVAFGGRILPDHLRPPDRGDYKPAKYMNSGDTPLFHKSRMLYSESRARQAAADDQKVLVVEGYADVISCYAAGFKGAVAPMGTALTEEQILILWKMIPEERKLPILCFDGDNAGRRAAARACERILPLLKPDQSALFAFLPEGQDPDDLIRGQGKQAFQNVLDNAIPLFDFLWMNHTAGKSFDTPESRAGLAKVLEDETARIADRTVQQYYRQAFRDRLYKSFGSYKSNKWQDYSGGNKQHRSGWKGGPPPIKATRPTYSAQALRKQILLAAVINHPALYGSVEEFLGRMVFENERLDLMRQAVLKTLGTHAPLETDEIKSHLKEQGFQEELDLLLNDRIYIHASFARAEADSNDVLSGWQEIWKSLEDFDYKKSIAAELRQTGDELARNFSKETEERFLALHAVHKSSEN